MGLLRIALKLSAVQKLLKKVIENLISEKTGCNVELNVNDIQCVQKENTIKMHLDIDIEMSEDTLSNLIDKYI